jgi:uncharacterized RmlC-like cupin family protein
MGVPPKRGGSEVGDADLDRLSSLVGDIETFAAEHWGIAPLLRRTGLDFTPLLDVDAVEALLLSPARRPSFRLVRDGETLPPERSTRTVRFGGARLHDVADVGRIADAVHEGATIVLQGLQRTWAPLLDLCRSLERATSHPVQANAYLTPAGAAGLARHHDTHDVVVLQVSGSKAWDVEGLGPVTMDPGDVCYLPMGTPHAAAAQDAPSLHVTLGLLRVTAGDLVRRALAGGGEGTDGFDATRPLPLGYARPERQVLAGAAVRDALEAAAAALLALDADAVAEAEASRARRRRSPHLTGQLRAVLALDQLGLDSVVVCRPDHAARLLPDPDADGRIVLELADRELRLPAVGRAAVERLLAGDPVAVGDLPGIDPESRVVLARRLVREQLLDWR